MVQPGFSWAAIRIGERQNFKFRRQLFDGNLQVVYFLAAAVGRPGNYHMGLHARVLGHALDDAARGVRARSENEKYLIILRSNSVRETRLRSSPGSTPLHGHRTATFGA